MKNEDNSVDANLRVIVHDARYLDRVSSPPELAEELILEVAAIGDAVASGGREAGDAVRSAIDELGGLIYERPEGLIMALFLSVTLHGLMEFVVRGRSPRQSLGRGAIAAALDVDVLRRAESEGRFPMSVREADEYLSKAFRDAAEAE